MKHSLIALALLGGLTAACTAEQTPADSAVSAAATVDDENKGPVFIDPKGDANVAVSGYDAVSYFDGGGVPVKGTNEHKVTYNGADYHFASDANAKKFAADPAKFAPKYGGHCAWAASRGRLATADPTKYRVVDGQLYLNFDETVQQKWLKDIPGFIEKADKAWPGIDPKATFDNQ
ncbi:MAG: YHS domain-containing (seleno)protein [Sphingorhabdus sp.]